MKKYLTPEVELVKFRVKDVLTASEKQGYNPDAQDGAYWNAGPDKSTGYEIG